MALISFATDRCHWKDGPLRGLRPGQSEIPGGRRARVPGGRCGTGPRLRADAPAGDDPGTVSRRAGRVFLPLPVPVLGVLPHAPGTRGVAAGRPRCGFDQLHLEHTPYDWTAIERELGLFKEGHNPKPVVAELHRFKDFIASLPFEKLPEFKREAVCILSREQDTWANAWGSFMLAKQAGFDIEFQYSADELKDSDLYIVPGISGATSFRRNEWLNLLEKVQAGATLYLSLNDGVLAPFNQVFGVEDQYQQHIPKTVEFSFADCEMTVNTSCYNTLKATTAEVLIADSEGNPLFTCGKLGKGTVYLLNVPVERHLSQTPGSFHGATAKPYFELYKLFAGPWLEKRLVKSANPSVTITEHKLDSGKTVITAVNNQPETADSLLEIKGDVTEMLYGDTLETIVGNNAVVFIIQ